MEKIFENNTKMIAEQSKIFKALGHPSRLLMLNSLLEGEKCVCDLQEIVGDDISTISRHLSVLKEAGIIQSEKRGTFMFYRLILDCLPTFLSCTRASIEEKYRKI